MGSSKSSSKREVYSNTILPQERKTLPLNQLEKATTTTKKTKVSRKKEIVKIRAEINKKEMQEAMEKINKTKS